MSQRSPQKYVPAHAYGGVPNLTPPPRRVTQMPLARQTIKSIRVRPSLPTDTIHRYYNSKRARTPDPTPDPLLFYHKLKKGLISRGMDPLLAITIARLHARGRTLFDH